MCPWPCRWWLMAAALLPAAAGGGGGWAGGGRCLRASWLLRGVRALWQAGALHSQ